MRLRSLLGSLVGLLLSWPPPAAAQSSADYFVDHLPGAPEGPLIKMHAGHIEVSAEHHANLFFWHFQNRHIANKQRTLIWLNGGPGCSSMDGALMEIGPYRVREGGNLVHNNGSWHEFANLLFIDNPVGTGYSYVDTDSFVHEMDEMANQFVVFLEKFFKMFPEYRADDLYVSGESWAGQHIPYVAKAILSRNKAHPFDPWPLKGLLIGNGWISPSDQYPSYLQFAYKSGILKPGSDVANTVEKTQAVCDSALAIDDGKSIGNQQCERILTDILRLTQDMGRPVDDAGRCVNMYDVRLRDSYPSCGMNWPPDLKDMTPYLRRDDVKRALHVNPDKVTGWVECGGGAGSALRQTTALPSVQLLPSLLEELPIVLFSGDQDLICNHLGTEEIINRMSWNGAKGFETSPGVWAPRQAWTFEDEPAGIYQRARNLTYVLFYNSSHMVPFDYPRRTRDMLDRFMQVDIGSIGGTPANSRLDGEKGIETSVGGHPNSTQAELEEQHHLDEATWNAYYKSGEVALVVVLLLAGLFFYWVWRGRRHAGYDPLQSLQQRGAEMLRFSRKARDVETAEAFDDDAEMANMGGRSHQSRSRDRFSLDSHQSDFSPAGKVSNGYGKHQ